MSHDFDAAAKLARRYVEWLKRGKNLVSVVQVGSSLRREDFKPNSDIDFLVIYENPVRKFMEFDYSGDVEVQVLRRGREQFLKSLEEGDPVELVALRFGRVWHDDGFFAGAKEMDFGPTEKTSQKWIQTASFNLMDAALNYAFPACMCCYFKALHHSAREFCRVIILEEQGKLLEGDASVLKELKTVHPELHEKFSLIIGGRKGYEKFEPKYTASPKIRDSGLGKYLLAGEDIAIKALKIAEGLNMPKVNGLISELQKEHDIDHYHGFHISPERKELTLHLVLKGDKSGFFTYNLENGELTEVKVR